MVDHVELTGEERKVVNKIPAAEPVFEIDEGAFHPYLVLECADSGFLGRLWRLLRFVFTGRITLRLV